MLRRCFPKHRLLRLEEDQRAPFSLKLLFFDDFFQIHFLYYVHSRSAGPKKIGHVPDVFYNSTKHINFQLADMAERRRRVYVRMCVCI